MEIIILFLTCMGFLVLTNAMKRGPDVPLPTEHFDDIAPGSIISVKIHGRNYIEYGVLYEQPENKHQYWALSNGAKPPFGPERFYMVVLDPERLRWKFSQRPEHMKSFAAHLLRRYVYGQQEPEHQFDMLFLVNNNKIFYTILSDHWPNTNLPISALTVIDVYRHDKYRRIHGSLKVWNPDHQPPNWVLKERQPWL